MLDWSSGKRKGMGGIPNVYQILPRENWQLDERNECLERGTKLKKKAEQATVRWLLKKGLMGKRLLLEPGEERPDDEDERKW